MFFDFQSSKDCLKEHKGMLLLHCRTDLQTKYRAELELLVPGHQCKLQSGIRVPTIRDRNARCAKEHKGYARVALPHRSTDLEPGGTGAAGAWPPAQASVRNPSQCESGHICMLILKRHRLHMLQCRCCFDIEMLSRRTRYRNVRILDVFFIDIA